MANIYRNFFIRGSSEAVVSHQTSSGKNLFVGKPLFDENLTCAESQDSQQSMLREAGSYASFADTQDVYLCKAQKLGVSAYYLALADWYGSPRVVEINVDRWTGQPGQTIRVKARDNVLVAGVQIVIRDGEWHVLEVGRAVQLQAGSAWWEYTTQNTVPLTPFPGVEAIAWDLAGNRASFLIS